MTNDDDWNHTLAKPISKQGEQSMSNVQISSDTTLTNVKVVIDGVSYTPVSAPPPPPSTTITHGRQITAAIVGPQAIGITTFQTPVVPATMTITNGFGAGFIKAIAGSAIYDGFPVSDPHMLIQGVQINSTMDIYASIPIVFRGCKISPVVASNWGIFSRGGYSPMYLLYCDIGPATAIETGELVWMAADDCVTYRCHLHHITSDGIQCQGKNMLILENLIDGWTPSAGAHTDGIQFPGTSNGTVIARNKIMLNNGQTGTLNLAGWIGNTSQITMDSNYLAGGSYCFYGPKPGTGNVFKNNIFGRDFYPLVGQWGPAYPSSWTAGDVWTNNLTDAGFIVPAPV